MLEEFVEASRVVNFSLPLLETLDGLRQPLASIQRAYRRRQRARGLCRSCSRRAAPGRASCADHLLKNRLRAFASFERRDS